ncbi:serine hydrolase domain-containing protein [Runella zeae]|uniref:serine hydrolase domain-containing protein n=2 Tax=Runella zeae TaxID=94255 RepID=UPI002356C76F|nr:serine hydrolase [Runella zeae]
MKKKTKNRILIGSAIVGLSGAIAYLLWNQKDKTNPSTNATAKKTIVPKQPFSPDIVQKFDDFLNTNSVAYGDTLMVYVSKGDREYQYLKNDNDPDTAIGIASGSKLLTSVTILSLVDANLLNLDEKLSKYLTWLQGYPVYQDVTLRQILAHQTPIVADSVYDSTQSLTLEQAVRKIVEENPFSNFSYPNHYSSSSYKFIAHAAEIVTVQKWEAIFKERIANKCDMKNTFFDRFSDNPDTGKGAQSSLNDFSHLMEMIRDNGQYLGEIVLSADSVKELEKLQAGSAQYGLGTWVYPEFKETMSTGAFGMRAWVNRNNNAYAVIMTMKNDSGAISDEFRALVRGI